jgi:hypothetical protein
VRVVIDRLVGAERLRLLQLPVGARRRIDIGAGQLGDLDRRHADAGTGRIHQHGLPGREVPTGHQHVPGGAEGVGERRGFLVAQRIGHRDQVDRRQRHVLRIGAAHMRAEIAVVDGAPVMVPAQALLAGAAGHHPPVGHPGAGPQRRPRARPEFDQHAAEIAAQDMREYALVRLVAAGARHEVVAVEPHRVDLHQRLARTGLRRREIVHGAQHVCVAIAVVDHGLHRCGHHHPPGAAAGARTDFCIQ